MAATKNTVESLLSYRLSILARLINRRSTRYFNEQYNLTLAEWRCLAQIALHDKGTVRDIADRTGSDKGQISRAATSLCAKKYIKRQSNKQDARSGIYTMTRKGEKLYEEILPFRHAENQAVLDILEEKEQAQLISYLDRIYAKLRASEEESQSS